jgi:hypothetical protein
VTWKQLRGLNVSRSVISLSQFIKSIEDDMNHTVHGKKISEIFGVFWRNKKQHILTILSDVIELYGRPVRLVYYLMNFG